MIKRVENPGDKSKSIQDGQFFYRTTKLSSNIRREEDSQEVITDITTGIIKKG
jgi:hypothetical protein